MIFFLFFAQNIDCGYTLEPPHLLMSTHNLCFGAKVRKICIPLHTPVLLYKTGFKGVFISRTCFSDENWHMKQKGLYYALSFFLLKISYNFVASKFQGVPQCNIRAFVKHLEDEESQIKNNEKIMNTGI